MSGIRFTALACAALLGSAGCGGPVVEAPAPPGSVLLRVRNDNDYDMAVYVRNNMMRTRLAFVSSRSSALLRLDPALGLATGNAYLEAEPFGVNDLHRSRPLMVRSGQSVEWRIAELPGVSWLAIR